MWKRGDGAGICCGIGNVDNSVDKWRSMVDKFVDLELYFAVSVKKDYPLVLLNKQPFSVV